MEHNPINLLLRTLLRISTPRFSVLHNVLLLTPLPTPTPQTTPCPPLPHPTNHVNYMDNKSIKNPTKKRRQRNNYNASTNPVPLSSALSLSATCEYCTNHKSARCKTNHCPTVSDNNLSRVSTAEARQRGEKTKTIMEETQQAASQEASGYLADVSGSWGRLRQPLWLASGWWDRQCDWSEEKVVCRDTREVKGRWVLKVINPLETEGMSSLHGHVSNTLIHLTIIVRITAIVVVIVVVAVVVVVVVVVVVIIIIIIIIIVAVVIIIIIIMTFKDAIHDFFYNLLTAPIIIIIIIIIIITLKDAIQDFFTISSLHRKLCPTHVQFKIFLTISSLRRELYPTHRQFKIFLQSSHCAANCVQHMCNSRFFFTISSLRHELCPTYMFK